MLAVALGIFTGSLWQLAAGLGVLLAVIICGIWIVILCRPTRNQTRNTALDEQPLDDPEGVIGGGGLIGGD